MTPPPPSADLGPLLNALGQIRSVLLDLFNLLVGQFRDSAPVVEQFTLTTGGTTQRLFDESIKIRAGFLQNVSTEVVSIFSKETGTAATGGVKLNAASAAGQGGGEMSVGNIDLRNLFAVRATGGLTLSIYGEK